MAAFPSMKSGELLRALRKLGYETVRNEGSHRILTAPGRPQLTLAYHSGQTFPPGLVRNILVKQVGLTEAQALDLVS
jgi:predicted RNA binding protein YcfA (HicA-like mRNA interferase family)